MIVIGSGVVGVSAAVAARSRGLPVLLLDRDAPAPGASAGNGGLIRATRNGSQFGLGPAAELFGAAIEIGHEQPRPVRQGGGPFTCRLERSANDVGRADEMRCAVLLHLGDDRIRIE